MLYRYVNGGESRRGKYRRKLETREAVKTHILTYEPSISHYRREHAPNRLYLPSDLTQRSMHKHYLSTNDKPASYQLYSRTLKEMNVSFVKLGHEECEVCVAAKEHKKISEHSDEERNCLQCSDHATHVENASVTRAEYRAEGDTVLPDQLVMSVDLQKVNNKFKSISIAKFKISLIFQVIQLPRLDGLKTIVFSQRVIAFNETFAPIGSYAREYPVVACIWPESVSGRSANDILSCFHQVILKYGHLSKLTLWLDNCSAQNKNWNFFQHLALMLNNENIRLKKVVLKYFESGHTFMAADSFHAAVEAAMRKDRVITFDDFKEAVQSSKKSVEVIDMQPHYFFRTELTVTQYTLNQIHPRPYIDKIRKIEFEKGSYNIGYANSVTSKKLSHCMLFSKKQQKLTSEQGFSMERYLYRQKHPRGINEDRKTALLSVVLPVIPEEKKAFFQNLPTNKGDAV